MTPVERADALAKVTGMSPRLALALINLDDEMSDDKAEVQVLADQVSVLRAENQRLRDRLATTEAREWQRYPLGRV